MYDFETLVSELLRNRPELGREDLMRRIAEKKSTVGAGYLTDQGALFLVAGELGVALQKTPSPSDMTVKDLYIGANDVTVVARVLAIYPVFTYDRKDGGKGRYRRLVLFDGTQLARMTVWDEKAEEVEKLGMRVDSPVKITNGYVKQGLDGKPNLNLGRRGSLELISETDAARLPRLSAVTERLGAFNTERAFAAVMITVKTEPRYSEFVRSDGSSGSLFQFGATGERGVNETRVVIWGPASRPDLKPGQKVVVTNLRSRRSTDGRFELHGDAGSEILPGESREPVQLRIAAVSVSSSSKKVILALDRTKRVVVLDAPGDQEGVKAGQMVRVVPDDEEGGRLFCNKEGSIVALDEEGFPSLSELTTKLRDAKDEATLIMVEVIALSPGTVDEIRLKDGSVIRRGELVIGDDTAELRVIGWRDQSDKLSGIQPGERLRISGTSPKAMKSGGWELQLGPLTVVDRIRVEP